MCVAGCDIVLHRLAEQDNLPLPAHIHILRCRAHYIKVSTDKKGQRSLQIQTRRSDNERGRRKKQRQKRIQNK